jgi:putative ABC transport system permease protein
MLSDLRFAVRSLLRSPGFTIAALLTLAIGIGANAAVLAVVNAVLLRPLPWPTADRLVTVSEYPRLREQVMAEGVDLVSWPNLEDWRRRQRTFERIVGYRYGLFSLTRAGDPEALLGASVSWDFFAVTGTPPRLGRGFRPEEDIPSPPRVVVISHRIWQERMDGRADAVGRALEIDGQPYTVIGVMDEGYEFPAALPQGITIDVRTAELWIPLLGQRPNDARGNRNFMALGLLRPGVDVATAQDDMNRVARELEQEYPDQNSGQSVRVTLLRERWIGHVRPALLILLGAIASVLLIACVNVANLILARGRTRMRELGVRTALGASPGRLIRQLGVEYLVLAGMGGLLGLFVAWLSLRGLLLLRPENLPRAAAIRLDGWTLLMTAGLTLLTAVLVGLLPTLRLTRGSRLAGDSPRTGGQSPAGTRVRHALTVAQVAVSLMLLVGAGLLLKSFVGLTRARLGFDPVGVMTVGTLLPISRYPGTDSWHPFFQKTLDRLTADPAITAAAMVNVLPLSGFGESSSLQIEGREPFPDGEAPEVMVRYVTPGYFDVMQIPLVAGRSLIEADDSTGGRVVLVSRELARQFFGGNAVGQAIRLYGERREIVGVVGDIRDLGPAREPPTMLYLPSAQVASPVGFFVVRGRRDPGSLGNRVREAVLSVDDQQPLVNVRPMSSYVDSVLGQRRFTAALMAVFALVALGLAVIGLYGVIAYMVSQRTREIGIRLAVGATTTGVAALVLRQGLRLALIGAVVGLILAGLLSRLLGQLLHGVSPLDPVVYGGVTLTLLVVAAAASFFPARRAAAVDPVRALKTE